MKIVPVSKQDLTMTTFNVDGRAGLISGEREKKWPQGWSSSEDHLRMDVAELAERAARERLRKFTCQSQARWPVQGWCKEDHCSKPLTSCKAVGQSRWPQGW